MHLILCLGSVYDLYLFRLLNVALGYLKTK